MRQQGNGTPELAEAARRTLRELDIDNATIVEVALAGSVSSTVRQDVLRLTAMRQSFADG
jgi:hypothetical protein